MVFASWDRPDKPRSDKVSLYFWLVKMPFFTPLKNGNFQVPMSQIPKPNIFSDLPGRQIENPNVRVRKILNKKGTGNLIS